jgi:cell division protein FtsN
MVGSFAESRNAEMMTENLQWMYPDEKVQIYTAVVEGRTMHRVTIGAFNKRAEAADLKQHIQETQGIEPVLITVQ